ncbi:MAG: hypothetical protein J6X07_04845 [Prevotella sp.]|nr:hypothetical protein [Prevotella sp.]
MAAALASCYTTRHSLDIPKGGAFHRRDERIRRSISKAMDALWSKLAPGDR